MIYEASSNKSTESLGQDGEQGASSTSPPRSPKVQIYGIPFPKLSYELNLMIISMVLSSNPSQQQLMRLQRINKSFRKFIQDNLALFSLHLVPSNWYKEVLGLDSPPLFYTNLNTDIFPLHAIHPLSTFAQKPWALFSALKAPPPASVESKALTVDNPTNFFAQKISYESIAAHLPSLFCVHVFYNIKQTDESKRILWLLANAMLNADNKDKNQSIKYFLYNHFNFAKELISKIFALSSIATLSLNEHEIYHLLCTLSNPNLSLLIQNEKLTIDYIIKFIYHFDVTISYKLINLAFLRQFLNLLSYNLDLYTRFPGFLDRLYFYIPTNHDTISVVEKGKIYEKELLRFFLVIKKFINHYRYLASNWIARWEEEVIPFVTSYRMGFKFLYDLNEDRNMQEMINCCKNIVDNNARSAIAMAQKIIAIYDLTTKDNDAILAALQNIYDVDHAEINKILDVFLWNLLEKIKKGQPKLSTPEIIEKFIIIVNQIKTLTNTYSSYGFSREFLVFILNTNKFDIETYLKNIQPAMKKMDDMPSEAQCFYQKSLGQLIQYLHENKIIPANLGNLLSLVSKTFLPFDEVLSSIPFLKKENELTSLLQLTVFFTQDDCTRGGLAFTSVEKAIQALTEKAKDLYHEPFFLEDVYDAVSAAKFRYIDLLPHIITTYQHIRPMLQSDTIKPYGTDFKTDLSCIFQHLKTMGQYGREINIEAVNDACEMLKNHTSPVLRAPKKSKAPCTIL